MPISKFLPKTGWRITNSLLLMLICLLLNSCDHDLSYYQLIEWQGQLSINSLITSLKHKDWRIRQEAARNLGNTQDTKAVQPLITALQDEDWRIQLAAAKALGKVGDAKAIKPLKELAKNAPTFQVGQAAKEALLRIKRRH